jgi:SpoIID/LytB domain protein
VYGGIAKEDPRSSAAVAATAGEVAYHQGHFVDTVYSSSCGGHTEDNDTVWGNAADPALRGRPDFDLARAPANRQFGQGIPTETVDAWLRAVPDSFCARASKTKPEKLRWSTRIATKELQALLQPRYGALGTLERLEVEERGRGGRVISLALVGDKGTATLIHELPIRQLFGNLNSGAFVVEHDRDAKGRLQAVTFIGGGWGHGVGMCQIGAIGRAEAGHDYRQILAHYYNGAVVERFYGGTAKTSPVAEP